MSHLIFTLSFLVICFSAYVLIKVVKEIVSLGFAIYAAIKQSSSIPPISVGKSAYKFAKKS